MVGGSQVQKEELYFFMSDSAQGENGQTTAFFSQHAQIIHKQSTVDLGDVKILSRVERGFLFSLVFIFISFFFIYI